MNKKLMITIGVIVSLLLIGGGVLAYNSNRNSQSDQDNLTVAEPTTSPVATNTEPVQTPSTAAKYGSYITAADYNSNPSKYADSTKVYFFHASWCPICRGIETEIQADESSIPAGVTIIKTDFDSSTDLRKKYGVTTQYTFVQIDNNGNETAQWTASSLAKALAGIKS